MAFYKLMALLPILLMGDELPEPCKNLAYSDTVKLKYGYSVEAVVHTDSCIAAEAGRVEEFLFLSDEGFSITMRSGGKRIVYCNLDLVAVKKGAFIKKGILIGHYKPDKFQKACYRSEILISDSKGRIDFYLDR